jgi:8-oxo-dGTP pyrophosphatase MutT (NUDIX family)
MENMKDFDYRLLKNCLQEPPGINGYRSLKKSAVVLPVLSSDGESEILFEVRSRNIRQGGEISLPGGLFDEDQDQSLEMTAFRETSEELGVEPDKIELIGRLDTVISLMGMAVEVFVVMIHQSFSSLKPSADEVERIFTLKLQELLTLKPVYYPLKLTVSSRETGPAGEERILFPALELGLPERYHSSWDHLHEIVVYPTREGVIWGITGRILEDFIGRIRNIR